MTYMLMQVPVAPCQITWYIYINKNIKLSLYYVFVTMLYMSYYVDVSIFISLSSRLPLYPKTGA